MVDERGDEGNDIRIAKARVIRDEEVRSRHGKIALVLQRRSEPEAHERNDVTRPTTQRLDPRLSRVGLLSPFATKSLETLTCCRRSYVSHV